ncbi:MAG: bifunctional phosphopantothenoylcysteine decarboxylase/phosphopantothenate--cysteine ligase CoaBC [Actinomycetota bacterium]
MLLRGRRVVVGVCGSIAAYKAGEVVRGLIKQGALVRVVMTDAATHFVGPATFAGLTGERVYTDLFTEPERVIHVELGRWAQTFLVCGATASTLERMASGTGSDIVCATYLMCRAPVVVAPAMHTEMWEHAAVQRNVDRVRSDGCVLVPPEEGDLASGDYGVGRLAEPSSIVEAVVGALTPNDLEGVRVLVTVGPTREAFDPVRYVSNRSTGRMGYALAADARRRGADVTVVAGPTSMNPPHGLRVVRIETAEDMFVECIERIESTDVAILNAAVADWRPAHVADEKVKKDHAARSLELEPTRDIAAELGRKKGSQTLVLFAAETKNVVANARTKLESKHADLIVANQVGRPGTGFESETNDAALVTATSVDELPTLSKDELARVIWDKIVEIRSKGAS